MKNKLIVLHLLLSTALLIAGGNIEPEHIKSTPMAVPVTESSSLSSNDATMVEGVVLNDDRIYAERGTPLIWQDQAYTEDETAAFKREHSAEKAGDYHHASSYCANLDYATFSDWRLPTSDELIHLHHSEGSSFVNTRDNDFWSSTATTEGRYYVVFPSDAMRYARSTSQSNFIRCVRNKEQ